MAGEFKPTVHKSLGFVGSEKSASLEVRFAGSRLVRVNVGRIGRRV